VLIFRVCRQFVLRPRPVVPEPMCHGHATAHRHSEANYLHTLVIIGQIIQHIDQCLSKIDDPIIPKSTFRSLTTGPTFVLGKPQYDGVLAAIVNAHDIKLAIRDR
jgi:hypothetical protein